MESSTFLSSTPQTIRPAIYARRLVNLLNIILQIRPCQTHKACSLFKIIRAIGKNKHLQIEGDKYCNPRFTAGLLYQKPVLWCSRLTPQKLEGVLDNLQWGFWRMLEVLGSGFQFSPLREECNGWPSVKYSSSQFILPQIKCSDRCQQRMCAKFRDEAQTQRIDIDQKWAMDDDENQPLHPNRSMCVGSDVQRCISAPHSGTFLFSEVPNHPVVMPPCRQIHKSKCHGLNINISSVYIVRQRERSFRKRDGSYIAIQTIWLMTLHGYGTVGSVHARARCQVLTSCQCQQRMRGGGVIPWTCWLLLPVLLSGGCWKFAPSRPLSPPTFLLFSNFPPFLVSASGSRQQPPTPTSSTEAGWWATASRSSLSR